MCQHCDEIVERGIQALDYLIDAERQVRARESGTPAQHIVRMATVTMQYVHDHPEMSTAVQDLAVGLAIAVNRLIGLQDIHGISVT